MAEEAHGAEEAGEAALADSGYEVIRSRLDVQGKALADKAERLNALRVELFGGTGLSVAGTERVRTEHNCVPRDVVSVGGHLLFGYNVFLGLKRETHVSDVFSLYDFSVAEDGFSFEPAEEAAGAFLRDPAFLKDFGELYTYYKDARLSQLRLVEGRILAVFQIGQQAGDVRVFRWAVDPDGRVTYLDNRGDADHIFPASHDFEWVDTGRDDFVRGTHPHVNVLDEVFVETVGGDLTVKVEDNTEDGEGIYREPVDDPDQSLDDAQVRYARVGTLLLLDVLPYGESVRRYLVFNTRTHDVRRIDAIGEACQQLPEDHGIIFPGGYYLGDGQTKTFEGDVEDMEFLRVARAPNGEDVLYVFYERHRGSSVLLPYNLIRKEVPPRSTATATAGSTTGGWWCSGRTTSRRGSTTCGSGTRRFAATSTRRRRRRSGRRPAPTCTRWATRTWCGGSPTP